MIQLIERLMEKQGKFLRLKILTKFDGTGIEYYEKNVANQLVEFMHYYVTETISEAKVYRDYA